MANGLNDFEARFVRGEFVQEMEYTPSSAVTAGEILVIGDIVAIAHRAIAADTLGSVAIFGGEYESDLANEAIAIGKKVYWDGTNITETASGTNLGICTQAVTGASGGKMRFFHTLPVKDLDVS